MPGGRKPPITLPSLPTTNVPKLVIRPSARSAPGTAASSATRDAGTVRAPEGPPPKPPPLSADVPGRTMTSPTAPLVNPVKARPRVSVKTYDPDTNATPRMTAKALRNRRSLGANRLRQVARSTASGSGGLVEPGHRREHPLGGRCAQLLDDP